MSRDWIAAVLFGLGVTFAGVVGYTAGSSPDLRVCDLSRYVHGVVVRPVKPKEV